MNLMSWLEHNPNYDYVLVGMLIGVVALGVLLGPAGVLLGLKGVLAAKKGGMMLKAFGGLGKALGKLMVRASLGGAAGYAAGSFSLNLDPRPGSGSGVVAEVQRTSRDRQLQVEVSVPDAQRVRMVVRRGEEPASEALFLISEVRDRPVLALAYVADLREVAGEPVSLRFAPGVPASLREWLVLEFVDQGFQPMMEWLE